MHRTGISVGIHKYTKAHLVFFFVVAELNFYWDRMVTRRNNEQNEKLYYTVANNIKGNQFCDKSLSIKSNLFSDRWQHTHKSNQLCNDFLLRASGRRDASMGGALSLFNFSFIHANPIFKNCLVTLITPI